MGKDAFSFPMGRKKTPFQKHKEQEEERKKREEEDAKKLYDEFVTSFGDEPEQKGSQRSFKRGGVIQPGSSASSAGLGQKKPAKYVPSFLPPALAAAMNAQSNPHTGAAAAAAAISSRLSGSDSGAMPPSAGSSHSERGGKPRNIDKMLESLKREQEAREERQRMRRDYGVTYEGDDLGSFDDGDPFTTNLYVGNLAPTVDEEMLKREFVRFGDIASVKIMWPRDDDQRRRGRNCGFVAFMTRAGADKAKAELNGILLHDLELKIGWGKSIVIPSAPLYTAASVGVAAAPLKPTRAAVPPPGTEAAPPWTDPHRDDKLEPVGPDIAIEFPKDARVRFIIDSLASYVVSDGCRFEMAAMSAQGSNPEFSFLFDLRSPAHAYYRWRLFSLSSGDSLKSWRIEPFIMVEGGPRWVPPTMIVVDGSHQTAAQRGGEAKDKDKPLPDLQRDRFEDLLRALTVSRTDICNAMVFALDNAESATEVVEVLADALSLPETPVPVKVARLLLVSDVLHNSTAPVRNASRYRSLLEAALPDIFESLQETYRSVDSRMAQESLRRYVLRVLRVWRSWFIFSDDFLNGLQATFLRGPVAGLGEDDASLAAELDALPDEDLEMRCRRSGLSKRGGRPAQISRLQALRAYLSGDSVKAEAAAAAQASRKADHEELAANLAAQQAPSVFDVNREEALAQGPPAAPAPKEEPQVKEEAPGIVSRWSLVDYDEDDDKAEEEKDDGDIFDDGDDTAAPQKDPSPPPDPLVDDSHPESISQPQVSSIWEREGEQAKPAQPGRPAAQPGSGASGGSAALNGTAEKHEEVDEPRRQRLRQVEVATMLFRDELEESGMDREDMDAAVAEHRAQLLTEAEKELAAAKIAAAATAAKEDSKQEAGSSKRSRAKDKGAEGEKEADKERERDAKVRSERKRDRSAERDAADGRKDRRRPDEKREREPERNARSDRDDRGDRGERSERAPRTERGSRQPERRRSRSRSRSQSRDRNRDREGERHRGRSRSRSRERAGDRGRSHSRERERRRSDSRDRERRDRDRDSDRRGSARGRSRSRERDRGRYEYASRDRSRSRERLSAKDRTPERAREERAQQKRKERSKSPQTQRKSKRESKRAK